MEPQSHIRQAQENKQLKPSTANSTAGDHKPLGRLILIDDHPAIGMIISAYLKAFGWDENQIDTCQSVDEAIGFIETRNNYSAILLDHVVPPAFHFRKSLDLLSSVAENTPIILITGLLPTDFGQQPIDSRITSVLEKDNLSPTSLHQALQAIDLVG